MTEFIVRNFLNNPVFDAVLLGAAGFALIAVLPILAFFGRGWEMRRADICDRFSTEAKVRYLQIFFRRRFKRDSEAELEFARLYKQRYGKHRLVVPTAVYTTVAFVAMFFVSEWGLKWIDQTSRASGIHLFSSNVFILIPSVAAAGISGAYLWVVADMVSRARRLDVTPWDVHLASLRMAMSAAIAFAIVAFGKSPLALPFAFSIGAFPLDTIRLLLRRIVLDRLPAGGIPDDQSPNEITKLDGIDVSISDRIRDADISTIVGLAWCDPVQLCMRTGLGFGAIVDFVSQALAWVYFKDLLDRLRPTGLRAAIEINGFLRHLNEPGENVGAPCEPRATSLSSLSDALLATIPDLLSSNLSMAQFLNACDQIANDPNTLFLVEIWHDGDDEDRLKVIPNYTKLLQPSAGASPPASPGGGNGSAEPNGRFNAPPPVAGFASQTGRQP
jgi:hypothetical protein